MRTAMLGALSLTTISLGLTGLWLDDWWLLAGSLVAAAGLAWEFTRPATLVKPNIS